jgi:hypothetical protein
VFSTKCCSQINYLVIESLKEGLVYENGETGSMYSTCNMYASACPPMSKATNDPKVDARPLKITKFVLRVTGVTHYTSRALFSCNFF